MIGRNCGNCSKYKDCLGTPKSLWNNNLHKDKAYCNQWDNKDIIKDQIGRECPVCHYKKFGQVKMEHFSFNVSFTEIILKDGFVINDTIPNEKETLIIYACPNCGSTHIGL